ncbi:stathmin domain-containing protein 1 [Centruroides vittatus]|uniref:stathmin domain-containing protein 1 n=1 Tax=Centruroides vittatus TaxID=120091 RepID=UPI00350F7B37
MGCAASKSTAAANGGSQEPVPKPVAFEIPMEENESVVKKHPPKRLQKLEEQAQQSSIKIADIEEKQQKAEERRQEILQERIRSSKKAQKIFEKGREKADEMEQITEEGANSGENPE